MTVGLLSIRLSGFARDWLIVNFFGATLDGDIAVLVVSTPDLLIGLIGNAGLHSYMTVRFREESLHSSGKPVLILQRYLIFAFVGGILGTLIAVNFEDRLVSFLAPGLDSDELLRAVGFVRWILYCLPFLATGLILAGWANAKDRYVILSFASQGFNLPVILGLLLLPAFLPSTSLLTFSIFVVGGILVRFLIQGIALVPREELLKKSVKFRPVHSRWAVWLACISGTVPLVVPLAGRAAASIVGEGALVVFNLLLKIGELPLVLFGPLFTAGVLPGMVDKIGLSSFRKISTNFLFLAIAVSFPTGGGAALLHEDIMKLVSSWIDSSPRSEGGVDFSGSGVPLFLLLIPKTIIMLGSTILFARSRHGALVISSLLFLFLLVGWLVNGDTVTRGIGGIFWCIFWSYSLFATVLVGCLTWFGYISFSRVKRRLAIVGTMAFLVWVASEAITFVGLEGLPAVCVGGLACGVIVVLALLSDRFWGRILRSFIGLVNLKLREELKRFSLL